jgi:hypothetical protein
MARPPETSTSSAQRLLDAALDQRELSRPEAARGLEQWRAGQATAVASD